MFGTFVKYQFQRTYDAILAAPVDTEELVTAEALWIATRAGVYGCVPMLVAMDLPPRPGLGNVNPLHHCVELVRHAAFGWEGWTDLARLGALVAFGLVVWRIAIRAMTGKLID